MPRRLSDSLCKFSQLGLRLYIYFFSLNLNFTKKCNKKISFVVRFFFRKKKCPLNPIEGLPCTPRYHIAVMFREVSGGPLPGSP